MDKTDYQRYAIEIEKAADTINLSDSVKTKRKGAPKLRDRLVFFKSAWSSAESWSGLPKAIVFWLGMTPFAIVSYNGFVNLFGLTFLAIPVEYGSVVAVAVVIFLMAFGFFAWTRFGLNRRSAELGAKQNPPYFLLFTKLEKVLDKVDMLEDEIKSLKAENNDRN